MIVAVIAVEGHAEELAACEPGLGAGRRVHPCLRQIEVGLRRRFGCEAVEVGGPDRLDQLVLGEHGQKLIAQGPARVFQGQRGMRGQGGTGRLLAR
jgi:hypothetical protein